MLLLLITVLSSAMMTVVFRTCEPKGYNWDNIQCTNYVFCVIFSLIAVFRSGTFGLFSHLKDVDWSILLTEKTIANSVLLALLIGFFQGFLYVELLALSRISYVVNGTSLTIMFEKAAFLVTIIVSVIFFSEMPTVLQIVGILLAIVAIIMNASGKGENKLGSFGLILICFFSAAMNNLNHKLISSLTLNGEVQSIYVLTIFTFALIFNILYIAFKNKKNKVKFHITGGEILAGLIAGIPNYFFSILQLRCLAILPATIVYPTLAAGNLLVITILSKLLFKEKITKLQYSSIVLTLVGLILVNV